MLNIATLAAALALAAAASAALLWWRAHRRAGRLETLRRLHDAAMSRAGMESVLFEAGTGRIVSVQGGALSPATAARGRADRDPGLSALEAALVMEDRAAFRALVGDARAASPLTVRSLEGQTFRLAPRPLTDADASRLPGGGSQGTLSSLVIDDITPLARETARLERAILDREVAVAFMEDQRETMPFPAWRRDKSLGLTWVNEAYARAVGTSAEAVLDEDLELVSSALTRPPKELARQALERGEMVEARRHVVVDGARRSFDIFEIPDPARTRLTGFAIDVTDLEETQAELARHIAAHADTLDKLQTAVSIFGSDKRLRYYNTAFATLWGLGEDFLASEPAHGEVLEALREKRRLPEQADFPAWKAQQLALYRTTLDPVEELLHLPDGATLRMVTQPHPMGGLLLLYEDVTDRLALERAFNTLSAVQTETINNLYEGVAVFGSDGRLKLHNPAYGAIWRLTPDFLASGPHITDVVAHLESFFPASTEGSETGAWPVMRERLIALGTDRTPAHGRIERLGGEFITYASIPLPDGAVLTTCVDVTDSTRVENALRERAEAMEEADRLKTEFTASISYELRTPLNAIVGFAEILNENYFGVLNDRQREYAEGILAASHQLLGLINDILDIVTIEAGFLELERDEFDFHETMKSISGLTREWAQGKDLEVDFDVPADIGTLYADERRIKQVLFNLLSNAIKFTEPGGRVGLGARREDGDIRFWVSDTGVGIAAEQLEAVFDKFSTGSPKSRHDGAGLGLALVRSLVVLHGGTVNISSAPGAGTTIRCAIPAGSRHAQAAEAVRSG